MKRIVLLSFVFLFLGINYSCSKLNKKMEIVRDCTGVYLKKDNKEYKVCNESKLESYSTGDKIKVEYDVLVECFGLIEPTVCLLYHEYESLIEVTKIK